MRKKRLLDMIRSVASVSGLLYLFYRNMLFVFLLGIPLFLLEYRRLKRDWSEERKWQINLEFREGLQGIAAALNAGYSVENALEESRKDLEVLYGKDCLLCREFQIMQRQLKLNQPIETVFEEFSNRCGVEDIRNFSEIFRTARRSGGDLVSITRTSARRIGERVETAQEIRTVIAGKQMEGKIMNIVPLGMIFYFWVCSPGFLDCFYQTLWGHLVMTLLLAVYLAAYGINRKICHIQI